MAKQVTTIAAGRAHGALKNRQLTSLRSLLSGAKTFQAFLPD